MTQGNGQQQLREHILRLLRAQPTGLSEFELIKHLEASGQPGFDADCLRNSLSLFQTHFLLFHTLYQLAEDLSQGREEQLNISPLCIQLLPHQDHHSKALGEHDPLRDYYLNLDNLRDTSAEDVDTLLNKFWMRFIGHDERRSALATLELEDPADWTTIKEQHRRLVMRHHPDRGGDTERLQAINGALDTLARSHRQ